MPSCTCSYSSYSCHYVLGFSNSSVLLGLFQALTLNLTLSEGRTSDLCLTVELITLSRAHSKKNAILLFGSTLVCSTSGCSFVWGHRGFQSVEKVTLHPVVLSCQSALHGSSPDLPKVPVFHKNRQNFVCHLFIRLNLEFSQRKLLYVLVEDI